VSFVGLVKGSRRRYVRELDADGRGLVVPFTFDPKACEIMLLAGAGAAWDARSASLTSRR